MKHDRPRPAVGHMPFKGHRTCAQVRADEEKWGLVLPLPEPRSIVWAPAPDRITVKQIQHTVADFYGVPIDQLLLHRRNAAIDHPRQVAIFLACELTPISMAEIGRRFDRDHTTVIHARRVVLQRAIKLPSTAKALDILREILTKHPNDFHESIPTIPNPNSRQTLADKAKVEA